MTHVLGRAIGRMSAADAARSPLSPELIDAIGLDLSAPPPLLLLPLRLEYRVVETNVPVRVAGNVRELLRDDAAILIETPAPEGPSLSGPSLSDAGGPHHPATHWRLDASAVTLNTQREIWFRWFPDDDFAMHGIAPPTEGETAALARFDSACTGKPWHALDEPAVISGWQALSREVEPQRALHLIRHRGEAGDPNYLEKVGQMALLPEKVALFAMDSSGQVSPLGEGTTIEPTLRYSFAGLQAGGWLTDFDVALRAGMALRLTNGNAVTTALEAAWIIAVGISGDDGAEAMTALIDDAIANGAFAFLPQDTPTNNTPNAPTPYKTPRADLVGFLQTAADAERGVLASPLIQSAEIFAEALGLDVTHVATAPNSGDLAFEDARAMVRVIGPALIDTAVNHTAALRGIDEEEVIDLFADAAVARGPLPPVRFGKNPYGVLPVVKLESLAPLASDTDRQKRIEAFVRNFALIIGNESQVAAAGVPVIQPGDPDAADKLEAILKLNPVSRRLEVGTVLHDDAKSLGCAYVTSQEHPAATYLGDLARQPINALPDPAADDATFPLLYRLARLSLSKTTILTGLKAELGVAGATMSLRSHLTEPEERNLDLKTRAISSLSVTSLASGRPSGFGASAANAMQLASGRFLGALQRLEAIAGEPDGVARLETLLMETIDLFQHRIDAWATGIAYRRLVSRRRAGGRGLMGGYWGMLGKLRPTSITGRTDGYIQAPSPHQATTAAVLRSAYLRHRGSGSFAIGLDSARVRRGMKLLEMLQTGLSPGEALGYLSERRLHDKHQDILIFRLRDLFPLRDPRDDAALETRLSDGLAFLGVDIATLVPPAEVAPLRALQDELRGDFDALADLVIAEATHLRAMGQADAANAWLQVLSGETIPSTPSVVRTRRNGHGSSHRVVVLIDSASPQFGDTPRAIVEPALAALATARLTSFGSAFVTVSVGNGDGLGAATERPFTLAGDLGLAPIDLLVGGESEIVLRARHKLVSLWRSDSVLRAALGPLPDRDIMSFINQTRPVTVDLDGGQTSARELVALAAELRRSVAQGRMLEPGDLSAAADPALPLTDALERDLLAGSSAALSLRTSTLANRLGADILALRAAIGPAVAAARNHQHLVDQNADPVAIALAMSQLETLRQVLDVRLVTVSHYAEPGALRVMGTAEIAADPDDFDKGLAALVGRLSEKAAQLASVLATGTPPANAASARSQRSALIAALRTTLDGDALPILPPFDRLPATTPLLQTNPSAVAGALAGWEPVRAKVARIASLFGVDPWRAYTSSDAATGADDADADARNDEGIAPRARLFGTFVAINDPSHLETFTGFTADEWSEQRPSRMQHTGLAINYDSPQSEPPHALLLCEPAGPGAPQWSQQSAAEMVAETIGLMKTRALSAQARPLPGPLFPFANQVPFKQSPFAPRIPVREFHFVSTTAVAADSMFLVSASETDVGAAGSGLFEISGFNKVKE